MASSRLDKWLWAARIFKTRTLSAQACKNGRVIVNGALAKSSHAVNTGDKISVRKAPITFTFEVLMPITQRVGAAKVPEVLRNITSKEQLEYLEMTRIGRNAVRDRGTGRPTKKERREIEDYMLTPEYSGESFDGSAFENEEDDFDFDINDLTDSIMARKGCEALTIKIVILVGLRHQTITDQLIDQGIASFGAGV